MIDVLLIDGRIEVLKMAAAKEHEVVLTDVVRDYQMGEVIVPALRGVSLEVDRGEFIAVLGQSGSGKTTLLNMVSGLDTPTSGVVEVSGQTVSRLGRDERTRFRRHNVGIVFQSFNLFSTLNVVENVEIGISFTLEKDELRDRALAYLEHVGIAEKADNFPSQLSGGEQQRVALARGLAKEPPLLVLDEPTGNLDAETSEEVWDLILRMNRETGATVIAVTHQTSVSKIAHRSVFLRSGQIWGITEGPLEE
ncbi:MAG: ABC transporter ATP-binding protein [Candidatus Thorarchaeota archaeon SMTZ1-83]